MFEYGFGKVPSNKSQTALSKRATDLFYNVFHCSTQITPSSSILDTFNPWSSFKRFLMQLLSLYLAKVMVCSNVDRLIPQCLCHHRDQVQASCGMVHVSDLTMKGKTCSKAFALNLSISSS
jgi:hypothetical protein